MSAAAERLAAIRGRVTGATPGPWTLHEVPGMDGETIYGHPVTRANRLIVHCYDDTEPADRAFIAHAREDVPWLLERVAELEAAVKQAPAERLDTHGYIECVWCHATRPRESEGEVKHKPDCGVLALRSALAALREPTS